ncbi:hypothetical protein BUALT_Bualt02G0188600 [Buddleja alternifolia]|uniref:Glycosyltransferase N-terminal domain-containing protein n=1 Tax=Buddleja alternifolia TaxID=168488 RepID=A0AAV6Y1E3_9LAMI|nr:hypothetical protein BUALT_Bualt02G0188600 [Buddleja alternifolia]
MEKRRESVVLFPFMAQGHIRPSLALAQLLDQKGYNVTFVNTPLNIKKLHKSLPPSSSIKLTEIPFNPSDHGLPPEAENTDSLSYNLICRFVIASPSLKLPFTNLLHHLIELQNGEKPLCVISDFFFGWAADVAHELGIFHAIFSSGGGFGMACYNSMWLNLPHKHTENVEFLLPDFPEAGKFRISQVTPDMHQAVARGTNFDVRQENIVEKMELVMGESEKGKELRRKACEIKEIIRDATRDDENYKGFSVKAMEEFFNAARLN